MTPIVTLTTDFGLSDGYVGTMHGVILGICPPARIVDLSHDIAPQNVHQGAFVLHMAHRYFPPGTVHVVVVDPGVGSERRAIAVQTANACFVAPDNGVLSYVLASGTPLAQVELTRSEYWLPEISQTFHGRDIFAPVGAHLANGVPIEALGTPLDNPVRLPLSQPEIRSDGSILAHVRYVDRFGNLITDAEGALLGDHRDWVIEVSGQRVVGVSSSYAETPKGELLALIDSSGCLEIAVREGSGAASIGALPGSEVLITPRRARDAANSA